MNSTSSDLELKHSSTAVSSDVFSTWTDHRLLAVAILIHN
jgi:hypothetical protein